MKRIQSACICQTLHFQLNENLEHELAVKAVQHEVQAYRDNLVKNRIAHRIVGEEPQPDGSVVLRIIKQYNSSPVGNYLD